MKIGLLRMTFYPETGETFTQSADTYLEAYEQCKRYGLRARVENLRNGKYILWPNKSWGLQVQHTYPNSQNTYPMSFNHFALTLWGPEPVPIADLVDAQYPKPTKPEPEPEPIPAPTQYPTPKWPAYYKGYKDGFEKGVEKGYTLGYGKGPKHGLVP